MNYGLRTTDYGLDEWRVFVDERRSAAEHMAFDERLAEEGLPTVRFFTWDPAAVSLGWRQTVPDWLEASWSAALGLQVIERPTGGGITFHGSDVSVAVIVPRSLAIPLKAVMGVVCESAASLCRTFGADATALLETQGRGRLTYCLTEQSPYAVLVDGRKAAGFALRRYPTSWLIQGSLLVRPLPPALAQAIPGDVAGAVRARAVPLAEVAATRVDERLVIERWAEHWESWWSLTMTHCGFRIVSSIRNPHSAIRNCP
ncbi:MAG: hypothetical protein HYY59_01945 [Candidatus Omnitrophica bacterium]|nr:hypothetical protein [Candidatus Omnitrophota bacterium]MBI2495523.1 hypothetical protein [Candidatus Omnitrophota bacterium]MBI3020745.1 hypothetical protein [Candidatus Omnitrophota bacterium]